jgi:hypothetical protein
MKKNFVYKAFFILLLFLFIPNIFSYFWDSVLKDPIIPDYRWIVLSFLSLLVLSLFAAIGYMLGGFFGDRVRAYSKNLFFNVINTAIIILIITTIFLFYDVGKYSGVYLISYSSIDTTIAYAKTVRNILMYKFIEVSAITAVLSFFGNMAPYFRPAGIIGFSFSIAPAFRPIFDIAGILISAISSAAGVWYGQIWFLVFIKTKLFALFMPIGIFLRATKFENIGNALIAASIGFYFIYPLILNLCFDMFYNYLSITLGKDYAIVSSDGKSFSKINECISYKIQQQRLGNEIECDIQGYSLAYELWDPIKRVFLDIWNNPLEDIIMIILTMILSGSAIAAPIIVVLIGFLLVVVRVAIEYVVILTMILPVITIFITFLSIDEISKFLGTEIDLSAFDKIF